MTSTAHAAPPVYPLYGPKYTIFHASPLYGGSSPLLTSLPVHERRFRDSILGDVLRRFQITSELTGGSKAQSSAGAFKSCSWTLLGSEGAWEKAHPTHTDDDDDEDDELSVVHLVEPGDAVGVLVEISYERASYSAVLLGSPARKNRVPGFTNLPLCLVKMPTALREAFVGYLATTFDSSITPMKLPSSFMGRALESILDKAMQRHAQQLGQLTSFPRGLRLQLTFPSVSPHLRTCDVHINQDDMLDLIRHGQTLWPALQKQQQQQQTPSSADYYPTPSKPHIAGPFTAALAAHLRQHLALDYSHPATLLSKLALAHYDLSHDGKIRIHEPSPDARDVWSLLLDEADSRHRHHMPSSSSSSSEIAPPPAATAGAARSIPVRGKQRPTTRTTTAASSASSASSSSSVPPTDAASARQTHTVSTRASERLPTDPPPPYTPYDPALVDELGAD
jgi:hypothetical protein